VFVGALAFWLLIAFPYLIGTADQMSLYQTERLWIILHVALNTLTNYVNSALATEIDFPVVSPLAERAA